MLVKTYNLNPAFGIQAMGVKGATAVMFLGKSYLGTTGIALATDAEVLALTASWTQLFDFRLDPFLYIRVGDPGAFPIRLRYGNILRFPKGSGELYVENPVAQDFDPAANDLVSLLIAMDGCELFDSGMDVGRTGLITITNRGPNPISLSSTGAGAETQGGPVLNNGDSFVIDNPGGQRWLARATVANQVANAATTVQGWRL